MRRPLRFRSGYTQTVHGLMRKHAELLNEIRETNVLLSGKQAALLAIEGALRVFDPTIALATEHQRRGDQVEGLYKFLLDMLRRDGAVTTLGVARALLADRGQDDRDRALLTAMRKRVGDALQKMRRQGRVTSERYGNGGELEWRLVSPTQFVQ
jgi:hypothetical protein